MITLISFIILIASAANWLSIGMLQYDFIAGVFGTQSSFLSRTIYIVFGISAIWMLLMAIRQKGKIKINDNGFTRLKDPLGSKNNSEPNYQPYKEDKKEEQRYSNVEADREFGQTSSSANVELGQEVHRNNAQFLNNPFEKDTKWRYLLVSSFY